LGTILLLSAYFTNLVNLDYILIIESKSNPATMKQPVIADRNPIVLELETGTYYWCSSGQSKNQSVTVTKEQNLLLGLLRLRKNNQKQFATANTQAIPHIVTVAIANFKL
jgi:hypothetical protein